VKRSLSECVTLHAILNYCMYETTSKEERAVLIGLITSAQDEFKSAEYLDELEFLIDTAGGVPVKRFVQRLDFPDPRTFVGSGKLEEITAYIKADGIEMAVFDDELSAAQIRNLEKVLECKVLDRTNLILDIFARRARTAHARTQVELAQLQYLLPRLTGMWTHLSKQRGGIGMRGPGETEIETDRRVIRTKISLLKEKLKEIDKQKIVGYTNVGKSTIMNLLAKSEVFAENKLFATLDTTVRKVVIGNLPFLLTDTVGFIRKLPHGLVESFKSTLDEVRESDLLIHVVDISHPTFEEQINVVRETLQEIGTSDKPIFMIFNKVDAYSYVQKDEYDLTPLMKENRSLEDLKTTWMAKANAPCMFISATKKINIQEFRDLIYEEVKRLHIIRYPYNNLLY
jgi:GTP-binding protein HflX